MALEAGVATGSTAIGIYAAATAGVGAAAVVGWQVGTAIGKIDTVEQFLNWMSDVKIYGWGTPTGIFDPLREYLTPPTFPDINYKIDYGPSSTPQDLWWYVAEPTDLLADNGLLYSDPIDAMNALEIIVVGGGGAGLYAIIDQVSAV